MCGGLDFSWHRLLAATQAHLHECVLWHLICADCQTTRGVYALGWHLFGHIKNPQELLQR